MSVAFYGTQETVLSFEAGTSVTTGAPVVISDNNQVADAAAGAQMAGIALHVRNDIAAVQVRGYAEISFSGTAPGLGWVNLAADGSGGVKALAAGRSCLVVNVDTAAKTVGLYL